MFPTIQSPKISKKFICETCDYKCSKQSEYTKHISTNKHKILQNPTSDTTPKVYLCNCGKQYKHSSTLYAHKKICTYEHHTPSEDTTNTTDITSNPLIIEKMFTLFTQLVTQNQDFMTNVIGKVQGITNNTTMNNTTNNTNNNQFNINMFLNEHCKNAMNISDFIRSLPITAQHYEDTKNHGLTDTLTNLVVHGLNQLDIIQRPIHCTDQKRKTMYVKDNDLWEKDPNNRTLIQNIAHLSRLQRTKVALWQDDNPDFATDEKLQMAFTNIIQAAFTFIEDDNKELNKILKGLGNATFLDDDTKTKYIHD